MRLALRPGRAVVGVLDETAHLALGLLAARRSRAPVAMVAGSMFIDADHLPSELGHEWLRHGASGRPYPHALVTLAALALVSRAAAVGLALHLGRDLTDSESGVRLLWPLTNREFRVAPWLYPVGVGALCAR